MNKSALKKFAVTARTMLMEQAELRARLFGISKDHIAPVQSEGDDSIVINGMVHDKKIKKQRNDLVKKVRFQGFDQVIEEAAYTWFNRFMALRFMEINDYLPTATRVLSSIVPDREDPDILVNCLKLDLPVDKEKIYTFQDKNDREGLYRYLLILQCNELNSILPFMFEPISDYTELLLPDNLLFSDSVINKMVKDIDEEDWKEVEVIGWLYQYYISEKKDVLIKAKKAYKSENIPAVTQLFTPEWIVKYMVQNSLGRYWLENRPDDNLKSKWEYYLEPRDKDSIEKLKMLANKNLDPETIKVFDPAMGSGHILVYAFDVLFEIYLSCGYSEREIPELILTKNLFGLDIDTRATQLAKFALMMKARQKNRRILRKAVVLNLYEIIDTQNFRDDEIDVLTGDNPDIHERLYSFVDLFRDAKTLGSIIKVADYDDDFLTSCIKRGEQNATATTSTAPKKLKEIMGQAQLLAMKFEICVANPPYMGNKYMNKILKDFITKEYKNYKSDLFTAFIKVLMDRATEQGHLGVMSPFVWMFIQSYQKLREKIIRDKQITSLIQLEYSGFAEATVPICTYTIRNSFTDLKGEYIRLSDFPGAVNQPIKTLEAITNPDVDYRHTARSSDFSKIPGSPIAYWVSDRVREIFEEGEKLGDVAESISGMITGDNNYFLRMWHEVVWTKAAIGYKNIKNINLENEYWLPYQKGGDQKKWYGNNEFLLNWKNEGKDLVRARTNNKQFYLKPCITWTFISSSFFSARLVNRGFVWDVAGSSVFPENRLLYELIGAILCSKLSSFFLSIINPTLNYQVENILKIPVANENLIDRQEHRYIFNKCKKLARQDWDNFETSWDFTELPLLRVRSEKCEVGSPCQCEVGSVEWEANNSEKCGVGSPRQCEVGSVEWKALKSEEYGDKNESEKSQGFIGMAKINEVGENDISADKTFSTGRNVLPDITNAQSSDINTIKHSRGASKEVNQGIHQLSINSSGIKGRTGNTGAYSNRSGIYRETGCSSNTGSTAGNQEDAAWFGQQSKINNGQKNNQLHTPHSPLSTKNNQLRTPHSPLSTKISFAYETYFSSYKQMTLEMQRLEEENNRIFIDAYGLQDELTPEVPLHEITLTGNPFYRYNYKVEEGTEFDSLPDELVERFKADTIKEFISYAVGCMMGRYSLEVPGLILAGGGKSVEDYYRVVSEKWKVRSLNQWEVRSGKWEDLKSEDFTKSTLEEVGSEKCGVESKDFTKSAEAHLAPTLDNNNGEKVNKLPTPHSTLSPKNNKLRTPHSPLSTKFTPDSNAILPVLDDDYFSDDIVSRFVEFVKVTFGQDNISDNLSFIADAIGRKGNESSTERIRKYFLRDFYKDHCQRYKKRPIYWMFTSGNKKGFNCLIYLHRYHPGMIAQIRTDYLHELQEKLVVAINNLEHDIEHGTPVMQKKARKRKTEIEKQAAELVKYDELMRHYADQIIELDLDDGVKVNYAKFGVLLEKRE